MHNLSWSLMVQYIIYICVCVFVYVYVYVCIYICLYVYMYSLASKGLLYGNFLGQSIHSMVAGTLRVSRYLKQPLGGWRGRQALKPQHVVASIQPLGFGLVFS